jgi:hypothetical protein
MWSTTMPAVLPLNGKLDDACLYYFDRVANAGNNNDSLYFTDQDRGTGGLSFALWNSRCPPVPV